MQRIQDFYIAPNAVVTGDVVLQSGVNVWYSTVIRGDLARITLHSRVNIQDGCILHTDQSEPMLLEEGVVLGHRVVAHGRSIGKSSLIGMGAMLLSGCEIGEECLIAAGSLITERRRIPARSVVMGVPGRIVREVTDEEAERAREISAHYLEMAQRYSQGAYPPPWLASSGESS